MAEVEDTLEVAADEKRMCQVAERAERQCVAHSVANACAVGVSVECMGVVPEPVWPLHLDVDEALARLPALDASQPANGHAVQAQPVLDHRSRGHRNRPWRDDVKPEPRWRDALEVRGVGVELEDLTRGSGDDLLASKNVLHEACTAFGPNELNSLVRGDVIRG
jgi:hypothetical protein